MNEGNFLKKHYWDITPALKEKLKIDNIFALPRLKKVVVNIGLSEHRLNKEAVEEIKKNLSLITGQIPVELKAKKSVASFKVRKGQVVALATTLRGERMWAFLGKLFHIALPRRRDFRGLREENLDKEGNLHIGLEDLALFPDVSPEEIKVPTGLSVDIVTTAKSREEAKILFQLLGVVFESKEARKMREEAQKKAKEEEEAREERIKLYKKQMEEAEGLEEQISQSEKNKE